MKVTIYGIAGATHAGGYYRHSLVPLRFRSNSERSCQFDVNLPDGWRPDYQRDRIGRRDPDRDLEPEQDVELAERNAEGFTIV
jgi:hypothetical protein